VKRGGKVWINVFPCKPVTAKPTESRMGKGKVPQVRGLLLLNQGESYTKLRECLKKLLVQLCVLLPTNYL